MSRLMLNSKGHIWKMELSQAFYTQVFMAPGELQLISLKFPK